MKREGDVLGTGADYVSVCLEQIVILRHCTHAKEPETQIRISWSKLLGQIEILHLPVGLISYTLQAGQRLTATKCFDGRVNQSRRASITL